MNAFVNYLLEANLAIGLFLLLYVVLLRNETDFKIKRGFILFSALASVILPSLHFNLADHPLPSIGDFVPPTWLPEVVVTASGVSTDPEPTYDINAWTIITIIYGSGVLVSLALFFIRLVKLLRLIYNSTTFTMGNLSIVETHQNKSSFSFFKFVFIGQADKLTPQEKQQIIDHECVHVQQRHSFDILLLNLLSVFFWFNPLIQAYKKILVQLHEFEADARAVKNRDVNDYCSLLAKVALLSADFRLANHFSNSLTVKRIEMMRTIKSKIRGWKIATILLILPVFIFVVSCQDQVMNDAQEIAKNSSMAIDLPEEVQQKFDELKKANPDRKLVVIEVDQNDIEKAANMKEALAKINPENISAITVLKNMLDKNGNNRSFLIIEYNEMTEKISENSRQDGDVFTIVEESASPVGGIDQLSLFIAQNLKYPETARTKGLEGKVFIQFVVNQDGTLTDFKILKGVDPAMDEEALRVAKLSPNWNPGKQGGKAVRQRFVLPIRFNLNDNAGNSNAILETPKVEIREVTNEFMIEFRVTENDGKKVITGKVNDESGAPIRGANIVSVGSTSGTVTDADGNFSITMPKSNGRLAVSFIGYKTETINY